MIWNSHLLKNKYVKLIYRTCVFCWNGTERLGTGVIRWEPIRHQYYINEPRNDGLERVLRDWALKKMFFSLDKADYISKSILSRELFKEDWLETNAVRPEELFIASPSYPFHLF